MRLRRLKLLRFNLTLEILFVDRSASARDAAENRTRFNLTLEILFVDRDTVILSQPYQNLFQSHS